MSFEVMSRWVARRFRNIDQVGNSVRTGVERSALDDLKVPEVRRLIDLKFAAK